MGEENPGSKLKAAWIQVSWVYRSEAQRAISHTCWQRCGDLIVLKNRYVTKLGRIAAPDGHHEWRVRVFVAQLRNAVLRAEYWVNRKQIANWWPMPGQCLGNQEPNVNCRRVIRLSLVGRLKLSFSACLADFAVGIISLRRAHPVYTR